jgi:hypothetical protein
MTTIHDYRRMTSAQREAFDRFEYGQMCAEAEELQERISAYEDTFEETAYCTRACSELGAVEHSAECRAAHAAPAHVAAPVAVAIGGWLAAQSVNIRRAA